MQSVTRSQRHVSFIVSLVAFLALLLVIPSQAQAACSATYPVGSANDGVVSFLASGGEPVFAATTFQAVEEGSLVYDSTTNSLQICDGTQWTSLLTAASGGTSQWVNGTSGAIYYDGGNVGIGNTGPSEALDVTGTATANTFLVKGTAGLTAPSMGTVGLGDLSDVAITTPSTGQVLNYNGTTGNWENATAASQWTNGTSGEIYYSGGNIGIGTTSPAVALEAKTTTSSIKFRMTDESAPDAASSAGSNYFEFYGAGIRSGYMGYAYGNLDMGIVNALAGGIRLYTNNTERMRIDNIGNVGIGGSPSYKLHAYGAIASGGDIWVNPTGNSYLHTRHINGKNAASTADDGLYLNYSSGYDVYVGGAPRANLVVYGTSGSNCTIGNGTSATSCSSGIRLKKDVHPIASALEKLTTLRGVYFKWKDPKRNDQRHIGLIAQEVEKVFPEAVTETEDPTLANAKAVDAAALVAPMIEAIKQLKAASDNVFAENALLKQQLHDNTQATAALRAQVNALQARLEALSEAQ